MDDFFANELAPGIEFLAFSAKLVSYNFEQTVLEVNVYFNPGQQCRKLSSTLACARKVEATFESILVQVPETDKDLRVRFWVLTIKMAETFEFEFGSLQSRWQRPSSSILGPHDQEPRPVLE
jgi:hypothetical protein